ncbi:MAG: type II toxin-antitoxin system HicB family antitoxin [Anaerolineae bacterium]
MRNYSVVLTPDPEEGGYTVRVPAFPGCNTQGETLAEALQNAQEAIELYLETLRERGEPIPEETMPIQAVVVSVAA